MAWIIIIIHRYYGFCLEVDVGSRPIISINDFYGMDYGLWYAI